MSIVRPFGCGHDCCPGKGPPCNTHSWCSQCGRWPLNAHGTVRSAMDSLLKCLARYTAQPGSLGHSSPAAADTMALPWTTLACHCKRSVRVTHPAPPSPKLVPSHLPLQTVCCLLGVWASAAPYGTSPTCLNPVPSHTSMLPKRPAPPAPTPTHHHRRFLSCQPLVLSPLALRSLPSTAAASPGAAPPGRPR